jgi:hypothetical protein
LERIHNTEDLGYSTQ